MQVQVSDEEGIISQLTSLRNRLWGDKFAMYLLDWLIKEWRGREHIYEKYKQYYELRVKMVEQLLDIYPDLIVQGEGFEGKSDRTKEVKAKEYPFFVQYAPILHYRKLPNEIVIEIDNPDKENMRKAVERLKRLNIEPLICFSGHKSWHLHVITYPEYATSKKEMLDYVHCEDTVEFTNILYKIILRKCDIEGLDVGVQLYKSHWIRAPYSFNVFEEEGKKKIGVKKPLNGDFYRVWFIPLNIVLLTNIERDIKKKEEEEKRRKVIAKVSRKSKKANLKKYAWIQKVLDNPHKIRDGRERLLWKAIAPYLVLKGFSDEEIEEICKEWIEASGAEWKSKYRCKVRSMVNHCRNYEKKTGQKWMPIRLSKLIEEFPDLKYIEEVVKSG